MRLLSYNIRFGGRGREEQIAAVIRDQRPDLVMFQESTDRGVVARLSEMTGLRHWAAEPGHSVGFLSREPVERHRWHRLPGVRHPVLEVRPAGNDLHVYGLHLSARFSRWSENRREREIRALFATLHARDPHPHVLVGDFNTLAPGERLEVGRMPAWIRALIWISGRKLERRTIRAVLESGYTDGWRHCYPDDPGYTFPVWDPHLRLDYAFFPSEHAGRLASIRVVDGPQAAAASDHFPLLVVTSMA